MRRALPLAVLAVLLHASSGVTVEAQELDALARFVAGLPGDDGPFSALERRPAWLAYAAAIDERWEKLERHQLTPMRAWAERELAGLEPGAVLYPFSGPDLIHVTTILPDRSHYILLSLEPVGSLPDVAALDAEHFGGFFAGLQQALSSALRWSFFQTRELRRDLAAPGLEGVLPLLLFFAARDGQELLAVEPLSLAGVSGTRLTLRRPGASAPHRVDYFSVDLGAHSLDVRRAFFEDLASRGPFVGYCKAASYLMFEPKYVPMRRFLLEHVRHLLQDDSGVPYAELRRQGFAVKLYGRYERPIRLFSHRAQADLADAHRAGEIPALPFAAGYRTRARDANLMLATRHRGDARR